MKRKTKSKQPNQKCKVQNKPQKVQQQGNTKKQFKHRIIKRIRRLTPQSKHRKTKNKNKLAKKQKNSSEQQKLSLVKATRLNSCSKRRNPYKIYTQKKKDNFFSLLNSEYNQQLEKLKHQQKLQKTKKVASKNNSKCSEKQQIVFKELIQIREYCEEQAAAQFMSNQPFEEEINQEQNKLDC